MSTERNIDLPLDEEAQESPSGLQSSHKRVSLCPPPRRETRGERRQWRMAQERVMAAINRSRPKQSGARPRHGAQYRGPLSTLLRELRVLLLRHGSVGASREKAVGGKTRKDRRLVMTQILVNLYRGGYKICHIKNIKGKHVRAILQRWVDQGIAKSTMATYVSHLRVFLGWLERPQLLAVVDRFHAEHPDSTRRKSATDRDKSERGANVDFELIHRRAVDTLDEYFVCQLLLIATLGLRVREAWLFRPHLSVHLSRVSVHWGTKGGRPRDLPIPITPLQQWAIDRACALVPDKCGSMIPPAFARMAQWSRKFYRQCRRIGLTKHQLGVTPHSLRHGVLLNLYEHLAGVPAPVRGGTDGAIPPAGERDARQIVAEFAGHSRPQVSSAYLGSRRKGSAPAKSAECAEPVVGQTQSLAEDATAGEAVKDSREA